MYNFTPSSYLQKTTEDSDERNHARNKRGGSERRSKEQGYPIEKITRMMGRNGLTPLLLIEVGKEYKSIYDLKYCCRLSIEVRLYKQKTEIISNATDASSSDVCRTATQHIDV